MIKEFVAGYNTDKNRAFDKILIALRGIESEEGEFEQRARIKVGARLPVKVAPDEWYAQLEGIVQGGHVEQIGYAVPAWECEKNSPLVRAFLKGIRSEGGTPRFVFKTGTADLNVVAPVWRCPSVVYGPGDSSLDHTPDEHISLDEYEKGVTVLKNVLKLLCQAEGGA
jgi:LysW-gamma-L-lysine carboxypeptidase